MVTARVERGVSQAMRMLMAGGAGLVVAVGLAACGADGGGPEEADVVQTSEPPVAPEESAEPALKPADAMKLARAAILPPDSPLLDDYEPSFEEPTSINEPKFAPLQDCTQEEIVDGRVAASWQVFKGPWPKIDIKAHAYGGPSVEVLGQLREIWDSECTVFEDTDSTTPYRSERVETIAAPEGVDPAHWAADCAQVTLLDDGADGIVFCSALVAVGEHLILDVRLSGLIVDVEQYEDLLGAIAAEVVAAQA
jgi:hypothetical protein